MKRILAITLMLLLIVVGAAHAEDVPFDYKLTVTPNIWPAKGERVSFKIEVKNTSDSDLSFSVTSSGDASNSLTSAKVSAGKKAQKSFPYTISEDEAASGTVELVISYTSGSEKREIKASYNWPTPVTPKPTEKRVDKAPSTAKSNTQSKAAPAYVPYTSQQGAITANPYDVFDYVAPIGAKSLKYHSQDMFVEATTRYSYDIEKKICYMDVHLDAPYTLSFWESQNVPFVYEGMEEIRQSAFSVVKSHRDDVSIVANIITADGYLFESYSDDGWRSYANNDFDLTVHSPVGNSEFSSSLVLDSYYIQNLNSFIQKMIVDETNITGSAVLDGFYDDKTNSCVLRLELTEDYASYSKETIDKITNNLYQSLQETKRLLEIANVHTNNTVITCDHNGVIIHQIKNGSVTKPTSCNLGHYVSRTSSDRKCEVCSCTLDRWPKLTAKEAMYNYTNSKGKSFHLKGYGELSNYYNYGYDEYEDNYFCLKVLPDGGKYSESWYVYLSRSSFSEIFALALSNGSVRVEMECNINEYQSGQNNMAKAVYVKWWN